MRVVVVEESQLGLEHNNDFNQVVPDAVQGLTSWIDINLTREEFVALKSAFPRHIFTTGEDNSIYYHPDTKDGGIAHMWDWLMVPHVLNTHRDLFEVKFVPFSDFLAAMLDPQASAATRDVWTLVNHAELVVGGVDFTGDYTSLLPPHHVATYMGNLITIMDYTVVWPDPSEGLVYGGKAALIKNLDAIAKAPRPRTSPIVFGYSYVDGKVIKRGHSGWGEHVCTDVNKNPVDRWGSLWEKPNATAPPLASRAWLMQDYVDTLRILGEIRCYFIHGTHQYTVHTDTSLMIGYANDDTSSQKSLEDQEKTKERPSYGWVNPKRHADHADRGLEELKEFARKTYEDLVKREEASSPTRSSDLTAFTRIDIGVMRQPGGAFNYVVNEVERSWGVTMFGVMDTHIAIVALTEFTLRLPEWVRRKHQRSLTASTLDVWDPLYA
ncbi:uncharacterized protein BXZ73DRAFT_104693 [Epithele typhae]|uniref:uncharacterized protein n=1 Tax=Epithele typhae TaxID=378194 RepID=UPI002007B039|nr:uncharacterized protein BXZ73DRAFT_104693 [Epithele typhae]KAH9920566.1 hypothetical protein BXZ73DRAFT_104693 [Epithele typhae]